MASTNEEETPTLLLNPENPANLDRIYKKNTLFIILIGITGFCFGLLDWNTNLADLVYLQYNSAFLISIVSANIGTARLIATLVCLKVNASRRPNLVFISCMVLASLTALIVALCFDAGWLIPFVIFYLLEILIIEVFSGYHYAYAYNSLPEEKAMNAHSKRIAVFKIVQAAGIAVAGYVCTQFLSHTFLIIALLVVFVFVLTIVFTTQVKNFPKIKRVEKDNLFKQLNIFKYTPYFRHWFFIRLLGKFALSSLVVLLSLRAIDHGLNMALLKTTKSLLWVLSGIGFFLSNFFIRKNLIVKGDILIKALIAGLIPIVFVWPPIIFALIILDGALNPFNTMSHLAMLRRDTDNLNVPQKDMVINLAGHIATMVSAYVLLNIKQEIALIVIITTLLISTLFELLLYCRHPVTKNS